MHQRAQMSSESLHDARQQRCRWLVSVLVKQRHRTRSLPCHTIPRSEPITDARPPHKCAADCPAEQLSDRAPTMSSNKQNVAATASAPRGRGRPPTYVWNGDEELSQSMENLKKAIERRRERQRENYHRKKNEKKQLQEKHQLLPAQPRTQSPNSHAHASLPHTSPVPVVDGAELLDFALAHAPTAASAAHPPNSTSSSPTAPHTANASPNATPSDTTASPHWRHHHR